VDSGFVLDAWPTEADSDNLKYLTSRVDAVDSSPAAKLRNFSDLLS